MAALGGALRGSRAPLSAGPVQQTLLQRSDNYLRPPVVLATVPGVLVRQQPLAEATVDIAPGATPEATVEALSEPTPEPTPEPEPAFFTYEVQEGDTISGIAEKFGISTDYILWNNPEVTDDPDLLIPGEELVIPSVNGLIYRVQLGDTLSEIADFYQIDVQSIVAFVPNHLESPDNVIEGMVLLLPGAVPPPPPMPAAVVAVEGTAPMPEPTETPAQSSQPEPEPQPASQSSGFIWPWRGTITSYFGEPRGGGSYHRGIDIDAYGRYGAPVVAAASGQVVLATYSDWGLGYHVILQHDDGTQTVYAHMSEIYVTLGQYVNQGEPVGAIGCTGWCTGPHLHFEIRINGISVDPLDYLP